MFFSSKLSSILWFGLINENSFRFRPNYTEGVIIYEQGISGGQKNYLNTEIGQFCKFFGDESDKIWLKYIKIYFKYNVVNTLFINNKNHYINFLFKKF